MDEEEEHFLSASDQKCILLSGTECHIINYLLTELAWAVFGNIGPWSFLYGLSVSEVRSVRPRANIPLYDPRARLVRGYYYMANPFLGKSLRSDWFFLGQDFAVRTVSMETVQSAYFYHGAGRQIQNLRPKQRKKSKNNVILHMETMRRS